MKPILFNTDMVRAIQNGTKTVTRRVVKPQPKGAHMVLDCNEDEHTFDLLCGNCGVGGIFADWAETIKAPFFPGDILYVRETWNTLIGDYIFRADQKLGFKNPGKWRPSIHMPREAARIFLRVTDVLVQQIKDITDADALLEGFYSRASLVAELLKIYPELTENSWVWVIGFKRCERPKGD